MRTRTRQLAAPSTGPVALHVTGGPVDLAVIIDDTATAAAATLTGPARIVTRTMTTTWRAGTWRITIPDITPARGHATPPRATRTRLGTPDSITVPPAAAHVTQLTVTLPAGSSLDTRIGHQAPPKTVRPGRGGRHEMKENANGAR